MYNGTKALVHRGFELVSYVRVIQSLALCTSALNEVTAHLKPRGANVCSAIHVQSCIVYMYIRVVTCTYYTYYIIVYTLHMYTLVS